MCPCLCICIPFPVVTDDSLSSLEQLQILNLSANRIQLLEVSL